MRFVVRNHRLSLCGAQGTALARSSFRRSRGHSEGDDGPLRRGSLRAPRTSEDTATTTLGLPTICDEVKYFKFPKRYKSFFRYAYNVGDHDEDNYPVQRKAAAAYAFLSVEMCYYRPLRARRQQALTLVLEKMRTELQAARSKDRQNGAKRVAEGRDGPTLHCYDEAVKATFLQYVKKGLAIRERGVVPHVTIPGTSGTGRTTLLHHTRRWFADFLPNAQTLYIPHRKSSANSKEQGSDFLAFEGDEYFDKCTYQLMLAAIGADPEIDDFPNLVRHIRQEFRRLIQDDPPIPAEFHRNIVVPVLKAVLGMDPKDHLLIAVDDLHLNKGTVFIERNPSNEADRDHCTLHAYNRARRRHQDQGASRGTIWDVGTGMVMLVSLGCSFRGRCRRSCEVEALCLSYPDPSMYVEAAATRLGLSPDAPRMAEVRAVLWRASFHAQFLADTFAEITMINNTNQSGVPTSLNSSGAGGEDALTTVTDVDGGSSLPLTALAERFHTSARERVDRFVAECLAKGMVPHVLLSLLVSASALRCSGPFEELIDAASALQVCAVKQRYHKLTNRFGGDRVDHDLVWMHPRLCVMLCDAVLESTSMCSPRAHPALDNTTTHLTTYADCSHTNATNNNGAAPCQSASSVMGPDAIRAFDDNRRSHYWEPGRYSCFASEGRLQLPTVNVEQLRNLASCICDYFETPPATTTAAPRDVAVETKAAEVDDVSQQGMIASFLTEVALRLLALRVEAGCFPCVEDLFRHMPDVITQEEKGYNEISYTSVMKSVDKPGARPYYFKHRRDTYQPLLIGNRDGYFDPPPMLADLDSLKKIDLQRMWRRDEADGATAGSQVRVFIMDHQHQQPPKQEAEEGIPKQPHHTQPPPPDILRAMHAHGIISGAVHGACFGHKTAAWTMSIGAHTIFSPSAAATAEAIAACRRRRAAWLTHLSQQPAHDTSQDAPPAAEGPQPCAAFANHPFTHFAKKYALVHVFIVAVPPAGGFTPQPFAVGGVPCYDAIMLLDDVHRDACPMATTYVFDHLLSPPTRVMPARPVVSDDDSDDDDDDDDDSDVYYIDDEDDD